MKTDEQAISSRRLEEYRVKHDRVAERVELGEFHELNTIARINEIFLRSPKPQKKFNHYVLGQDDRT